MTQDVKDDSELNQSLTKLTYEWLMDALQAKSKMTPWFHWLLIDLAVVKIDDWTIWMRLVLWWLRNDTRMTFECLVHDQQMTSKSSSMLLTPKATSTFPASFLFSLWGQKIYIRYSTNELITIFNYVCNLVQNLYCCNTALSISDYSG